MSRQKEIRRGLRRLRARAAASVRAARRDRCAATGKARYASEGAAVDAAMGLGQRAYLCEACDGWHLTTTAWRNR